MDHICTLSMRRQITNMLGQALQTFLIDLDVIGEEIITSKIYEWKKQRK